MTLHEKNKKSRKLLRQHLFLDNLWCQRHSNINKLYEKKIIHHQKAIFENMCYQSNYTHELNFEIFKRYKI